MSRLYYRVGPSIWDQQWTDDERIVAVYLLTCQHRNTEGLFRLPLAYAIADLRWPLDRFEEAFSGLIRAGFVEHDPGAQVVWIVKAIEWQSAVNGNQAKHAVKVLSNLPQTPLLARFRRVAERVSEPLRDAFVKEWGELLPETHLDPPAPTPAPTPQASTATQPPRASENVVDLGRVS